MTSSDKKIQSLRQFWNPDALEANLVWRLGKASRMRQKQTTWFEKGTKKMIGQGVRGISNKAQSSYYQHNMIHWLHWEGQETALTTQNTELKRTTYSTFWLPWLYFRDSIKLSIKVSDNKSIIIVLVTPTRNQEYLYYTQIWLIKFHVA